MCLMWPVDFEYLNPVSFKYNCHFSQILKKLNIKQGIAIRFIIYKERSNELSKFHRIFYLSNTIRWWSFYFQITP